MNRLNRLTRILHFGGRVQRAVATNDGPIHAPVRIEDSELDRRVARILSDRMRTRDAILNAVPTGKVLALGTVWAGSLEPEIDARLDALRPIVSGFTSGRVLSAEPAAASLDMGRRWIGDVRDIIRAGARDSEGRQGEKVDLTALSRSADRLEDALERGDRAAALAANDELRRSFAAIRERHGDSARRTADARLLDHAARERDATRATIQSINAMNRQMWSGQAENGTRVPNTAAVVPPAPARTRDWAMDVPGGSPFVNGAHLKHSTPRTLSVAELNARNRLFWAEQDGPDAA